MSNQIWGFISTLVNADQVGLLLLLLVSVVVTSILAAIKTQTLDWHKLPQTWIGPSIEVGTYFVLAFFSQVLVQAGWSSAWEAVRTGAVVLLTGALTSQVMKNLNAIWPVVPAGWSKVWGIRRLSVKLKS